MFANRNVHPLFMFQDVHSMGLRDCKVVVRNAMTEFLLVDISTYP